ncbi:MAG: hypothetical protein ACP5O1_12830, partial [Phycisphaerae bacterium]
MSNELGMAMKQAILALKARGWSHRRIGRELGIHRETVGRCVALAAKPASNPPVGSDANSKPANNPPAGSGVGISPEVRGVTPPAVTAPATAIPGLTGAAASRIATGVEAQRSGPASACEPYRSIIEAKLAQGLTAQRIYQDLVAESGFAHSYDSIKRFSRRICRSRGLPFRRMECLPGVES